MRRRAAGWWAMAVLVTSCAPKSAEPLPAEPRIPHAEGRAPISNPLLVRAPRPNVTFPDIVPDLAEEPRWPLTGMQHPSLQPSFDIADAVAEPGITWTDLCARNVDRRRDPSHRDELIYLSAWCATERHDPAAAVGLLAQVHSSAVPGIAHAVAFDLANILVDSQDAEHTDQILAQTSLRTAALYDIIAAAYFEIGRNDDALRANGLALQLDNRYDMAATCHRLARTALLGPKASQGIIVDELKSAAARRSPDPVCVELAASVACAVNAGCGEYRTLHNVDAGTLQLAFIAEHWTLALSWKDWMGVAEEVHTTVVRPQSDALFDSALEAAVVGSECDRGALRSIATTIDEMFAPAYGMTVTPKAAWARSLVQAPADCTSFRTRWLAANPQ